MGRRNISGRWGESRVFSVRLSQQDHKYIKFLREQWPNCTSDGEVIRQALEKSAYALYPRQVEEPLDE